MLHSIYYYSIIRHKRTNYFIILGGIDLADIKYEIVEEIAVISESSKGWTKELNLISWNDREPKYDIRDWSPNKEKMGKGVTLTKDELISLREALSKIKL